MICFLLTLKENLRVINKKSTAVAHSKSLWNAFYSNVITQFFIIKRVLKHTHTDIYVYLSNFNSSNVSNIIQDLFDTFFNISSVSISVFYIILNKKCQVTWYLIKLCKKIFVYIYIDSIDSALIFI